MDEFTEMYLLMRAFGWTASEVASAPPYVRRYALVFIVGAL